MLASVCRRRGLLLALAPVPISAAAGAATNCHSNPSTVLLSHIYSLTPVAPNSDSCPTTVAYLVSCGVSPATAAIRKVRIRDTDKADAVRELLREYGFSDAEVTRTVVNDPLLLTFDPDRILRPKLEFLLLTLGFPPRVIASEAHILARSLDKHLIPCVEFLRGILGSDANIRIAVSRTPRALLADLDNSMRPAVQAFLRHGLSKEAVAKLLLIHLGTLVMPLDRISEACGDLKELGLSVTDTNFLYAIRVMCSLRRETWRRKMELYKSFGVSEVDLIRAFKTQPTILLASEESIKKKVRFFLDVLKLDLISVMQHPMSLSLSLEKCVKPRCAVLSLLARKGKIVRKIKLIAALVTNSRVFSERFVLKYADDVPSVVKAFEGKIKFEGFEDRELEFLQLK
jgi:mTERF domain-containing protein, mitochondrial